MSKLKRRKPAKKKKETVKPTEKTVKKKETPIIEVDGFELPDELELGIPAGTFEEVTFLITGELPGLLQNSTRLRVQNQIDEANYIRMLRLLSPEERDKPRDKFKLPVRLPEEHMEFSTYPTSDGRYYHPAPAFLGAMIEGLWASDAFYPVLREGGKTVKNAPAEKIIRRSVRVVHIQSILLDPDTLKPFRQPIAKKDEPLYVERDGKRIALCEEDTPYVFDTRGAQNRLVGLVTAYRPHWPRWATFVRFIYDIAPCKEAYLLQGLKLGGSRIGVGAFRLTPPRKRQYTGFGGPFGPFTAEVWNKPIPKDAMWER